MTFDRENPSEPCGFVFVTGIFGDNQIDTQLGDIDHAFNVRLKDGAVNHSNSADIGVTDSRCQSSCS